MPKNLLDPSSNLTRFHTIDSEASTTLQPHSLEVSLNERGKDFWGWRSTERLYPYVIASLDMYTNWAAAQL